MKNKIYGLLVFLFVPMIAVAQTTPTSSASGAWNISRLTTYGLPAGTLTAIIVNILNWLLFVLGIVGVIGFVISGIMYLISTGDQTMIDRAKRGMTYSIVGVIVGLAGLVVIRAIDAILDAAAI